MARTAHKKSRRGCATCKARHVKVGLTKSCNKHGKLLKTLSVMKQDHLVLIVQLYAEDAHISKAKIL